MEVWETLARTLGVDGVDVEQVRPVPGLHPGRSGLLTTVDGPVGEVGEVDPGVLEVLGITERVAWLQVELDALLAVPHGDHPYRRISRYPSSDLDLAFEVDEGVPAAHVGAAIRGAAGELLVRLELFDVFRGAPVPEGRRSLAYRLRLQAPDRTLTDADIATVRDGVVATVEANLPARLRA